MVWLILYCSWCSYCRSFTDKVIEKKRFTTENKKGPFQAGCFSHNVVSNSKPLFPCVTLYKGSCKIDLLESRSRMALGTALMCNIGLFNCGWQLSVLSRGLHRRHRRRNKWHWRSCCSEQKVRIFHLHAPVRYSAWGGQLYGVCCN